MILRLIIGVICLSCTVAAQGRFVSPSPCRLIVFNDGATDDIEIDFATDSVRSAWTLLKTFARRHGIPFDAEKDLERLRDLARKCSESRFGATASPLSGEPVPASKENQLSRPRPVYRTAGRWVIADFNGDGLSDSVVPSSNSLFIQITRSNGELPNPVRTVLGPPTHIYGAAVTADLNGDNRPDLILCCDGFGAGSRLVTSVNNGDGTFQTPRESIPATTALAVADFNGDGRRDVVTANPVPALTVSLSQANGSFTTTQTLPLTNSPGELVAGDFDRDSRMDVLVMFENSLQLFSGRANGTLAAGPSSGLPFPATKLLAGDFNNDGIVDAAVFDSRNGAAALLLGQTGGTFRHTASGATGHFEGVTAADLDDDGLMELLVPSVAESDIQIIPVSRIGELGAPVLIRPNNQAPAASVSFDFDADGRADLAYANQLPNEAVVSVLRGDANLANLRPAPGSRTIPRGVITALAAGDFNGDGRADLAAADSTSASMLLLPGRGDGTFDVALPTPVGASPGAFLATGDVNGDGVPDAALATPQGVRIFRGARGGGFAAPILAATPLPVLAMVIADVNADSRADVVYITQPDNAGTAQAGFALQQAGGGFAAAQPLTTPRIIQLLSLAVGDVTRDGRPDILLGGAFTGGPLLVLRNNGNAAFAALQPQSVESSPRAIHLADIDRDGNPDLLVATCCGGGATGLYYGVGDGTFGRMHGAPTLNDSTNLALADFDGDGRPEVVLRNSVGVAIARFQPNARLATVSAASNVGPRLAPDSIASGYGPALASTTASADTVNQTELAGTTVTLFSANNAFVSAPLFFVSPNQVNYLIPSTVPIGPVRVLIRNAQGGLTSGDIEVTRVAPGIFVADASGLLAANIVRGKPDGTQTQESAVEPISFGEADETLVLVMYGTGIRRRTNLAGVRVMIGGEDLPVMFAGAQGGFQGLDQVNVALPRSLAGRGSVEVILTVEGQRSNAGRLVFR